MNNVHAVIMAGGAGTRFWPASRQHTPKQLLPLAGDPHEALLAATVRRLAPLCPHERVVIATGRRLVDATRAAVPGIPAENFLAEPVPRNTAPCIGWASRVVARRDPGAIVVVLPSDHHVADEDGFRATLARAIEVAKTGRIVTVGITPTRPDTGYGYVETSAPLGPGAFAVARFVEKPDRTRAEAYVASGKFLWNGGMFIFRARDMQAAIARHLPELAEGLDAIDLAAARGDEAAEVERTFPTLPSVSIDVGVMEKEPGLAVVPGSFGWSDVGSWESAWELAAKDAAGNAAPGAILVDASGNLVRDLRKSAEGKVIALVGVHDLVVVETDDALLVLPRERAQDVRAVVAELERRGARERL